MRLLQRNYIKKCLVFIGDIVFPPNPDALLVRSCNSLEPIRSLQSYNSIQYCLPYQHKSVRAVIHEAKFHANTHALQLLGTVLENQLHTHRPSILIPIPLSRARERERGHNQVTSILKYATLPEQHVVRTNILKRVRHTSPQSALPKAERLRNLDGAFTVIKPELLHQQHVIIVDDVVTTGATLQAAKAALLPHSPASITCLALAH